MKTTFFINRLLIALFLAALVTPAIFLKPDEQAAAAEKRTLAPWPGIPKSRDALAKFPRAFDAFFADHFGFRRFLIINHSRISFFVLRTSPSPKVILGKNGFIFLKGAPAEDGDPIADFRGTSPLTPYELERWRWQLEDQHEWLKDHGFQFFYAVIPGKEHMNAEFMPTGYENIGQPGSFEQFVSHVEPRATYPFINMKPAMQAAREQAIIYRKTDTHWNDTGAWAGIFALTERMRNHYPSMPKLGAHDLAYSVMQYIDGDMGNMIGLPGETFEWMVKILPAASRAKVTPLTDHPLGDIVTEIPDPSLPRAVLFHDSFGHFVKNLLGEYFQFLRFRWSNAGIDTGVVLKHQPDAVIHMMSERRIRLGQRYEMGVQQHGNRNRFERSTNRIALWNVENGFEGIQPAAGTTRSLHADGLELGADSGAISWTLPFIAETKTMLPVICVEVTTPGRDELALAWKSGVSQTTIEAKGPLPGGRSVVYLPLLDPEATGDLSLQFIRSRTPVVVHRVEIRGITR